MARAPALTLGEVHLWRAELDVDATVRASLSQSLSKQERERADRFHVARDRARYAAARGWLRVLVASYLGMAPDEVRIVEDAGGKPRLPTQDARGLQFSLSHSAGLAVIAIAREREVGVDVEQVRPNIHIEAIAHRLFTTPEQRLLRTLPDEHRVRAFFAYWTMKEAYVKATGIGLRGTLPGFDAPLRPGDAPIVVSEPAGAAGGGVWSVQAFEAGTGYSAAVAIAGDRARIPQVACEIGRAQPAHSQSRTDPP